MSISIFPLKVKLNEKYISLCSHDIKQWMHFACFDVDKKFEKKS